MSPPLLVVSMFVLLAIGAYLIGWHARGEHDGQD
jgi:hypothetical protein